MLQTMGTVGAWRPTTQAGVTACLKHSWLSVGLILPCPQKKVLIPFPLQKRSSGAAHAYVLMSCVTENDGGNLLIPQNKRERRR